jgi:hypothetical protein
MMTQGIALRMPYEKYRKRQIRIMVRKLSDYQRKRLLDSLRTQINQDQLIEFTIQELAR